MTNRYLWVLILAGATVARAQTPEIFAPGVISGSAIDLTPAFTPDCRTVFYTVGNGPDDVIMTSHFDHGHWGTPTVAPFSGRWRDLEVAMAPDGSYLIFASDRPATNDGTPVAGNYNGAVRAARGGNLWRVDRRGAGWSAPVRLSDVVNGSSAVFSPSIVADGSLYFMKPPTEGGKFQLFRSQFANGAYQEPVRLSFSDEQWANVDASVAPDESFAVFSSNRPPTSDKDLDLFIVFRHSGAWGTPTSLGPTINSPVGEYEAHIAPDGHTLFFGSDRIVPTPAGSPVAVDKLQSWNNGLANIWRVDIAPWLKDSTATTPRATCTVP